MPETSDELATLRAEVSELRATVNALLAPRHGDKTILGQNVFIDPACTLLSGENATIRIGDHTKVWRGGEWTGPVTVGARVFVNQGSYIRPLVTIEDDVSLGPFVRLISDTHDISSGNRRTGTPKKLPITIGRGTWIGAGATVLGGVTIGERSIIAVGAVVTGDIPANVVAAGVPARVIRAIRDTDTNAELVALNPAEAPEAAPSESEAAAETARQNPSSNTATASDRAVPSAATPSEPRPTDS